MVSDKLTKKGDSKFNKIYFLGKHHTERRRSVSGPVDDIRHTAATVGFVKTMTC